MERSERQRKIDLGARGGRGRLQAGKGDTINVLNGPQPSTRVIYALLLRQPNGPLCRAIVERFRNR